ncbi:SPFH domain-containing protein [Nocardia sp. NPDC059764]|uniref:SPFH domain-containing protein n=1 Tax=Nocardia sp. NPDC059764 TaxID=3346939 RepID=UPI003654D137
MLIEVRAGSERFPARAADSESTIPKHAQVLVVGSLGGRTVERALAGSMTVEDMISDQDKFSEQVRDRCSHEMESFGLVIDSFQIQSIASALAEIIQQAGTLATMAWESLTPEVGCS